MTECDAPNCSETAVQPVTDDQGRRYGYVCSPECSEQVERVYP